MRAEQSRTELEAFYRAAAQEYLERLPLRHFMEATTPARQRAITLACLALICAVRPDVHVFNELLVQYPPRGRGKKLRQVVPDNMVVLHPEPIQAEGSFDLPLQPAGPFWVLEYVSKNSRRKDYDQNMVKYERDLKGPYYLLFAPEAQELTLYHLEQDRYVSVKPNAQARYPLPELELEMALLDGWVRFWFRGELVPLPAELLHQRDEARRERDEADHRADQANRRAEAAEAELARLRAQLAQGRQQGNPP
jgi:Uma2 family endonuclease